MLNRTKVFSLTIAALLVLTLTPGAPPTIAAPPEPLSALKANRRFVAEAAESHLSDFSALTGEFSDNFDAPDLDPGWEWIDPQADCTSDLISRPGYLRISVPHGGNDLHPNENYDAPRLLRPVTGNFTVTTSVTFDPQYKYQGAGILAWQNSDNQLRLERSYGGTEGEGSGILFDKEENGHYSAVSSTASNPTTSMLTYLRLARVGDKFYASYSFDAIMWYQFANTTLDMDETIKVGLAVINQHQDHPIQADFDFFRQTNSLFSVSGSTIEDSSDNPIPDVTVSSSSGVSATTNASGVYTITPTKTGWSFEPPTRTVSVPPSATGVDFAGSVVDADRELAERFAPYMYFHRDDIYRPITVTIPLKYGMLSNDVKGIYSVSPTLTDLTTPEWNDSDTYIDLAGDGPRVIRNYYNRDIRPRVDPLAFARVVTDSDDIAIQYWFYYYDNDWSNHHEGDWEVIQVVLDSDETPKYANYAQHRDFFGLGFSGPSRRLWKNMDKDGEHPKVYVARGSHASYFRPFSYFQVKAFDRTGTVGLGQNPIPIQIIPESQDKDTWVYFKGSWGGIQGIHHELTGNDGPPSPSQGATETRWNDPITWSEGLPWDENAWHNKWGKINLSVFAPFDVHLYKLPGMEHVGWKEGQVEEEIPTSEYFDNPISGRRTIVLHEVEPVTYSVGLTYRPTMSQKKAVGTTDDVTFTLHILDMEASTIITNTYHLSQTWNVSSTGVISIYHGSDLHLRVDIDGDGTFDQDIPPTTMDETPFDFTAPAPITDLEVLTATTETVTLTWTATGDDEYTGTVSAYDIRYYTDPITDANWVSATLIISPPVPSAAGTTEVFTITEIPCGRHYLAIQAVDDVLHYSELSNVVRVDIPCYLYLPLVLRNYEPLQPMQAGFVATPTTGTVPLTVTFTNTSTGPYTSSLWDFGDGFTSTLENPTYTYTDTGTYTVTLTISGSGEMSTLTRPSYITVAEPADLDVTYISRIPKYDRYHVYYPDGVPTLVAGTEDDKRWPDASEPVTFTAHVINKGSAPAPQSGYQWLVDDAVVESGNLPALAVDEEITVTYQWAWQTEPHTVTFRADTSEQILEFSEANNFRQDRTNALSLAIYVDPAIYERFGELVNGVGSKSFEDWIQWQVVTMNERLSQARYPTSPQGVIDRVRVDHIEIASQLPEPLDYGYDGRWFFSDSTGYADKYATQTDWGLVHELSHQLGVIDLYRFDVSSDRLHVLDQYGQRVGMSFSWQNGVRGIMGGGNTYPYDQQTCYSSHTAGGLNSHAGYRRGYYGEYLFDTPDRIFIQVLDNEGNPVDNATVTAYQRSSSDEQIDNESEIQGNTDADGLYQLENRNPVGVGTTTATGHTLKENPFGSIDVVGQNGLMLLKIAKGGHEEFHWFNLTDVNLNYWDGATEEQTYVYETHIPPDDAPEPPTDFTTQVKTDGLFLAWNASSSPNVIGYNAYRIADDGTYVRVVTETSALSATIASVSGRYVATALDDSGRESGNSNARSVRLFVGPKDVVVDQSGYHIVLDAHSGSIWKYSADGNAIQSMKPSVHLGLVGSEGLAISSSDQIIVAKLEGTDEICIIEPDGQQLDFCFGDSGSEPGQFSSPRGVVVDSQGKIYVADTDNHRIQAFQSDGQLITAYGIHGSEAGKFDRPWDVAVDGSGNVIVSDYGNDRLQKLSFDGSSFTHVQTLTSSLDGPKRLAVDALDRIYVADSRSNLVKVLSSSGDLLQTYDRPTDGSSDSFSNPSGVALDTINDKIVVVDEGHDIVSQIDWSITSAFAPDGYHLMTDSAAIDRGVGTDVTTDVDGDIRPQGADPDLGADEYVAEARMRRDRGALLLALLGLLQRP